MKNVTKSFKRSAIVGCALLATASFSTLTFALDEHNVAPGLTAVGAPLGLHGVDPVVALAKGAAMEGSATFTLSTMMLPTILAIRIA